MLGIFLFIVIGLLAGWMANFFTHGGGLGTTGNIIVGIIGSFLGGLLFQQFGTGLVGEGAPVVLVSFVAALVGAVVLLIIAGLIKR
jgi:uncharacterized membrane protein YeaQ/YmgE (transglycosylase-associated protein family)